MNILQLCNRVPLPAYDGGTLAMYQSAEALHACGHQVKMLCINTLKHFSKLSDASASDIEKYDPEAVAVDTGIRPLKMIASIIKGESYNIERFRSAEFADALKTELKKKTYHVVHLESLFMMPYLSVIRKYSTAAVILRAHNAEHVIWERMARNAPMHSRPMISVLASLLKKYELQHINSVDGIITITDDDKNIFINGGCTAPIHVMPFGIDPDKYLPHIPNNKSLKIFHLGSMDWMPNAEGVQWFMETTWPLVRERVPDAYLYLAGRNMPKSFEKYVSAQVSVEGAVEDAGMFMRDKDIMIVPLLSGSGMRVKIVEGMAYGKTIISTSTGAEGIAYHDHEDILIADSPEAFAACIGKCAENRALIGDIGSRARGLTETTYSNHHIAQALSQFYMSILSH